MVVRQGDGGGAVAVGLWWAAMADGAPWFLAGPRPGTRPSPVTAPLVLVEGLLVSATAVAGSAIDAGADRASAPR